MTVKCYCKDGYHAEHNDGPLMSFEDYVELEDYNIMEH